MIGQQSMEAALAVTVYRANIAAERERARLFQNGVAPHFLTEPPSYVDSHVEAIQKWLAGDLAAARQILDRAEEERPALTGSWNGAPFEDLRDYNDWTAPALELIVKDKYAWLALEHIRAIEIDPPRTLRDLVWMPARIQAADGTKGEVYVPTLYYGSSAHADDQVRLGRVTDWKPVADDLFQGMGLRLFLVDGEEQSILDTRRIELDEKPASVS
jgi:type VI secretion system protein ImpE